MSRFHRIAVGTLQPEADGQFILWGLMEVFRRQGVQIQDFLSRACFPRYQAAAGITGLGVRHLDSWLMSPEVCRALFLRGAASADLSIVEGPFDPAIAAGNVGGRLEPLCQWLDLPRLAVLDVARLERCRLPPRPDQVDGLLLDGVSDAGHHARLATDLESLWGLPVLAAMESVPALRAAVAETPEGEPVRREICQKLGDEVARYWDPQRILGIAARHEAPRACVRPCQCAAPADKLTVAIAYDEAFNCYFPDTFDLLELRGASVVDFSPLRDEHLPAETDIVYFGCGHPERFAAALAENHCMKVALRSHLCGGRRIYGEGGGAAYLCQHLETPDGQWKRMTGLFPAVARLGPAEQPLEPVEATLARSNWFGQQGWRVRGYRNTSWRFEPLGTLTGMTAESTHPYDLIECNQAVGSLLHLNFAAQPDFLQRFFCRAAVQPNVLNPWAAPR
jgi:cobyrinic acid a,c-diamide synthase